MEQENPTPVSKTQREKVYLGVIIFLVLLSGFLSWQLFDSQTNIFNVTKERDVLQTEKNQLTAELNDMLDQYDQLETENKELTDEMLEQKGQIQDLLDKVEKGKATARELVKYKKEVVTLRTIMKGYVVTIDSLNTVNTSLVQENTNMRGQLTTTKQQKDELQEENLTLSKIARKAQMLKALDVELMAIRLRSNGKQTTTSRAERAEMFRTCIDISDNLHAVSGGKTIFIQLEDANGNIVSPMKENLKLASGDEVAVSASRDIDYKNEAMEVCIYTQLDSAVAPGEYIVNVYELGALMGSATSRLK